MAACLHLIVAVKDIYSGHVFRLVHAVTYKHTKQFSLNYAYTAARSAVVLFIISSESEVVTYWKNIDS